METLKRKRQDDLSRSAIRRASLLIYWAEHLPEPMPQPPPKTALTGQQLSPVIYEEEDEYLYNSCYEKDGDAGGLPPHPYSDVEMEYVSWSHGVAPGIRFPSPLAWELRVSEMPLNKVPMEEPVLHVFFSG